jgi:ubiquinone/menaquinone biosynthesis C-methylase UbiE
VGVGGVSFDRAAGYYDATRGLPDDVREALADILAGELAGRGPCLEIGVGTGRIAIPLQERGVPLIGTDISPAMLGRLVANAGGRRPFPLLLADATRLPIEASSVGAVMASHLLHLIPEWGTAVDDAMRVLRPGGVLLVDFGGGVSAPWSDFTEELLHGHGVFRIRPGVSAPEDVTHRLGDRATVRPLPPLDTVDRRSLGQDLRECEDQIQSWTWRYSADQLGAACTEIRGWAVDHGWSLDREVELGRTIQWWAFDRAR